MSVHRQRFSTRALLVYILFLTMGLVFLGPPFNTAVAAGKVTGVQLFDEVWQAVRDHYFDPKFDGVDWDTARKKWRPKAEQARTPDQAYKVIDSLLAELKDPGTYLLSPEESKELEKEQAKQRLDLFGVGMILGTTPKNEILIRLILPGAPAAKAGIKRGDRLVSVNGKSVQGITVEAVAALVRGPKDSKVALVVKSPNGKVRSVTAVRDKVSFPIKVEQRTLPNKVGYVAVPSFSESMETQLLAALRKQSRARALILDLRHNLGGGSFGTLQLMAGLFGDFPIGMLSTREGVIPLHSMLASDSLSPLIPPPTNLDVYKKPVAILIDETTTFDLLALAMRENQRAILVGRPTRQNEGQGQAEVKLKNGSVLSVTTSRMYSPLGNTLLLGVTPDVIVPLDEAYLQAWSADKDPDITAALRALKQRWGI